MLKEQIKDDLKAALKAGQELEAQTLRQVLAAVLNQEKQKRYQLSKEKPDLDKAALEKESQLTDEEVIDVLFSESKKRKDAINQFRQGNREDLVEKEKKELTILQKYLPEQLPKEEIQKLAEETIKKLGAESLKDMGKVMAQLMLKLKGQAEGGEVSQIVKELLS